MRGETIERPVGAAGEWRRGWGLVVASATGVAIPSLMPYTMGVFIQPLQDEFGWSRALITSGLMINATIGVVLSALVGLTIDRFGPRRIALPGVVIFCCIFGMLSTADGSGPRWWGLWVLLGLASTMVSPMVWTSAVVSRFDASRGLATSLALVGASMTAAFGPIVGGYIASGFGWRVAYLGLASLWLMVSLPLVYLFFFSSIDLNRKMKHKAPPSRELSRGDVRKAFRSKSFYKIGGSCAFLMIAIQFLIVHFVPIVEERGLTRGAALLAASVVGFSAIAGRIASGLMLDRFPAYKVGGFISLLPGMAVIVILADSGSIWAVGLSAFLVGLTGGAEMEIASNLASRYFPVKNYGVLFGAFVAAIGFAAGFGPFIAARVYDTLGSYEVALWCTLPISLGAALLLFSLGPIPSRTAEEVNEAAEAIA